MANLLTRDDLFAATKVERNYEPVYLSDLGGELYVYELSGGDIDDYNSSVGAYGAGGEQPQRLVTAKLLARCIYDGNGERMFDPRKDQDLSVLSQMPYRIVRPLDEAAQRVNGLTAEAQEDMRKNSSEAPSDDTRSSSSSDSAA